VKKQLALDKAAAKIQLALDKAAAKNKLTLEKAAEKAAAKTKQVQKTASDKAEKLERLAEEKERKAAEKKEISALAKAVTPTVVALAKEVAKEVVEVAKEVVVGRDHEDIENSKVSDFFIVKHQSSFQFSHLRGLLNAVQENEGYCGKKHDFSELGEASASWFKLGMPRHGCVCVDCKPVGKDGKELPKQPLGGRGCKAYVCNSNSDCRWAICHTCQSNRNALGLVTARKRKRNVGNTAVYIYIYIYIYNQTILVPSNKHICRLQACQ
jgi:hypothetical protein